MSVFEHTPAPELPPVPPTAPPPSPEPITEFGPSTEVKLPLGTQVWAIQMPTDLPDATYPSLTFCCYVHNGMCIDGGEEQHRWLVTKPTSFPSAMRWFQSKQAHGRLIDTVA